VAVGKGFIKGFLELMLISTFWPSPRYQRSTTGSGRLY